MISNFQHKGLSKLFIDNNPQGLPPEYATKIRARLEAIDAASDINDLRIPGYDVHELKGNRQGTWSIKVSANWRITFKFDDGNAYDINFEDYH
ncbi:MAG TPA: type II toxin-antitoxin system RelE/ParE family toxin [Oscillatoriaceae cyanobacterium M33_DOE_052]|uniref:Killer protein n=1 Tax=Planktothricoides sp. SpSt-374 TaxID=2282167 RepID=A0A7C3VLM6_9CYAN|nr:type II toxin-antitoxin system RelE/ParE family toxin [Oscillatoriaceae cyanobacterium M33_DOE_052]